MKKKNYLFGFLAGLAVAFPSLALAGYGLEQTAEESGLDTTARGSLADIVGNVIGAGLTLIGVLFFILMIYAGISWMLARGNEEISKKALSTVTAAIIGLILVIASYAITRFVFQSVGTATQPTTPAPGAGTTAVDAGCCVVCTTGATGGAVQCVRGPYFPSNASSLCQGGPGLTATVNPNISASNCN